MLGSSVKVVGRDSRPFQLQGSLASAAPGKPLAVVVGQSATQSSFTGEFGASWQSFSAFNCLLGPTDIKGRLTGGTVQFQPIDTSFNQGRFKLQPTLRFDPAPAELTLAKGWMVERARLTPAVSSGALSYAVPILAGVAEADGQVSVHLDSGKIPLSDAQKADLTGQIHIHNAQVGPSAMVRELSALLIKGNQHFSIASNSVVPFQLVKGRVYHRDLEIVFPEVRVRTHGSVGLDGTVAIMAEMPIPPKWLGSGRMSQALAKQTVRLPIGGTLDHPRIDENALRTISAQVTRDLAADVIRQELENNLKKLFGPKK